MATEDQVIAAEELSAVVFAAIQDGNAGEATEELRRHARALAQAMLSTPGELDSYLHDLDGPSTSYVAASLPIIDAGDEGTLVALGFTLSDIAAPLADGAPGRQPAEAVVAVARIIWLFTAFILWRGRFEAFSALTVPRIPAFRPGTAEGPLLTDLRLRYPDVLARDPSAALTVYLKAAKDIEFLDARYPDFVEVLEASFAEADLLLALRTHAAHDWANYSAGASWKNFSAIRRFRQRLSDPDQRAAFAQFFGVDVDLLPEMLERLYAGLQTDPTSDSERPPTFWG